MDIGSRVRVVGGRKHKDKVGTVFWTGPDKYHEGGVRLGLHGDDGETIWVRAEQCEALTADDGAFALPKTPTFAKGDTVRWTEDDEEHAGEVFWVGEQKDGSGQRLGIRHAVTGDTVWRGARQVEAAEALAVELPTVERGDRVRWIQDGEERAGEVFWAGEKDGSVRLGIVEDGTEERIWRDARFVALEAPLDDDAIPF